MLRPVICRSENILGLDVTRAGCIEDEVGLINARGSMLSLEETWVSPVHSRMQQAPDPWVPAPLRIEVQLPIPASGSAFQDLTSPMCVLHETFILLCAVPTAAGAAGSVGAGATAYCGAAADAGGCAIGKGAGRSARSPLRARQPGAMLYHCILSSRAPARCCPKPSKLLLPSY